MTLCSHSRLSVALRSQGFEKGNKIHIVTNNNTYYHSLLLAVWRLGGVTSCGDSALNAETIQYQVIQHMLHESTKCNEIKLNPFPDFNQQIEEIKAKFVVCDSETEKEVKRAIQSLNHVRLLSIGRVGDSSVADLAALAPRADEYGYILPRPAELEGSDPWEECAVVLWSSGTTGRPKGILHREIMRCHIYVM